MPGCGNSGSKEEEIFGETGVENVHGAHPSAGVDEHPSRIRYDACSVALSQLAFDLFVSDLVTLTLYWDPFSLVVTHPMSLPACFLAMVAIAS